MRWLVLWSWLWYVKIEAIVSRLLFGDEEDIRDWRRGHHFGTAHGDLKLFGRWRICDRASWE